MNSGFAAASREAWADGDEFYRFTWRSSFDGDVVVEITKIDEMVLLSWNTELCFARPHAPTSFALSSEDWDAFGRAVDDADFWALECSDPLQGFDGAQWRIEGRRSQTYHAVECWSPGGALYDLGRVFFGLAGRPLDRIKLY